MVPPISWQTQIIGRSTSVYQPIDQVSVRLTDAHRTHIWKTLSLLAIQAKEILSFFLDSTWSINFCVFFYGIEIVQLSNRKIDE